MPRLLLISWVIATAAVAMDRPNVVLVMTDDQGYGDLASHGNPVLRTPELDRLHAESVRLTDFHVDPSCSPTRAALMTGKYSHRARVWHTINGGNHLRDSEITMADIFRHNGYRTAMFGKWHLGGNYPYRPIDRGFDEWVGHGDGGTGTTDDYFWNDRVNDHYWTAEGQEYRPGYAPDVFFDAAIDFVGRQSPDQPFFLYVPTYVPHGPLTIPDREAAAYYEAQGVPASTAHFFAMIESADANVGRLRRALEETGQADNTIFIFLTDNGSAGGWRFFNAGMRGHKGQVYDGGHRVPCLIHWPKGDLGAPRDVATLSAHIDLLPTLVEWAQLTLPEAVDFDGQSLAPQFADAAPLDLERTLVVERQRVVEPQKGEFSAVMTERWRLVDLTELYDIEADPAQTQDIAGEHPEVVARLRREFDAYWAHVTPDHRSPPAPIVGTAHDDEIFLSTMEYRESRLWNHAHLAVGPDAVGEWHVRVASTGEYDIEVRRWPRETDATMTGVPEVTKTVDAWGPDGPRPAMIYGDELVALPIAEVEIAIGGQVHRRKVAAEAESVLFSVGLEAGPATLRATYFDPAGERLSDAYYVYLRKQ